VTNWNELAQLPVRRIVGLMSGTSVDGIDAALVEVSGTGADLRLERIVGTCERPYTAHEKARIHALFDGGVADICEMNVLIGEWFAEATLSVIRECGLTPSDVHLIGSHGQTIYHIPPTSPVLPGPHVSPSEIRAASSLQIGEAQVIAERTGIATIANFRARDLAAGGHGAPLVPYVDWALFRDPNRTIALQNIGGIANVTVVTPDLADLVAFDTGPGNMIIDAATSFATEGKCSFDENGVIAARRKPDESRLAEYLHDRYFEVAPPKSTGREYWGAQYVEALSVAYTTGNKRQLVTDMTELTARSIYDAYDRFILSRHSLDAIFLSGGGAYNLTLRSRLAELFAPIPVALVDDLGIPSDAKEAVAFAILANETVCGTASNVMNATGASHPCVLGHMVPGA
jgi:anhydro-N-acetylmuramic acid kinase